MDSWGKGKIICLSLLSVEEFEYIYIAGIMVTRLPLFGMGGFLVYHKGQQVSAATGKRHDQHEGMCRGVISQTHTLNKLNCILAANSELTSGMETNLEKLLSSAWWKRTLITPV